LPIIENTVKANRSIAEELYTKGGITLVNNYKSYMSVSRTCTQFTNFYLANDIDTSLMLDKKADIISSWALFMHKCPVFIGLTDTRNSEIFATVMATLKQESYRASNPNNILVVAYNAALNLMKPKVLTSGNTSGRLTAGEVMDCLGATIGGALSASSSLIRDFVNVINGTNLGWSGIKSLSKSFIRTVASSNALGAAIGFGFCIAWETFF